MANPPVGGKQRGEKFAQFVARGMFLEPSNGGGGGVDGTGVESAGIAISLALLSLILGYLSIRGMYRAVWRTVAPPALVRVGALVRYRGAPRGTPRLRWDRQLGPAPSLRLPVRGDRRRPLARLGEELPTGSVRGGVPAYMAVAIGTVGLVQRIDPHADLDGPGPASSPVTRRCFSSSSRRSSRSPRRSSS